MVEGRISVLGYFYCTALNLPKTCKSSLFFFVRSKGAALEPDPADGRRDVEKEAYKDIAAIVRLPGCPLLLPRINLNLQVSS